MNNNKRKDVALGMPHGTAAHKLRKAIIFDMAKKLQLDVCYKCQECIQSVDEFSIEHKTPWLYAENPIQTFFALDNIAFSHLACNKPSIRWGGTPLRKVGPEGTSWCVVCQKFLDEALFAKDATRWNGIRNLCRDCHKTKRKT